MIDIFMQYLNHNKSQMEISYSEKYLYTIRNDCALQLQGQPVNAWDYRMASCREMQRLTYFKSGICACHLLECRRAYADA